jgi:hypothetical protein
MKRIHYVLLNVFHLAINEDKLNTGTVEIFHFEIGDPFTHRRDEVRYGHFSVFHSGIIRKISLLNLFFHSALFKQSASCTFSSRENTR